MYSATFAMTVIIGIAVINLLLGFAAAVLSGRGPKRWSDLERAFVLQPVSLRGVRWGRRAAVEHVDVNPQVARSTPAPAPLPAAAPLTAADQFPTKQAESDPNTDNAAAMSAAAPARQAELERPSLPVPERLVLAPQAPVDEPASDPPEKTLNQQLNAWRHGDCDDETPSLSGLRIEWEGIEPDDARQALLAEAADAHIKGQLRKDRRVLRIGTNQFAWLSCDVSPEDALMPIERIRQMLIKTRFQHQGDLITASVVAAVVNGLLKDDAEGLLKQLHATLQYAMEKNDHATYLDNGSGPEEVEEYPIEVEETVCEL